MADIPNANVDEHMTTSGKICVDDPTEYLKRQPKKSILKMKQIDEPKTPYNYSDCESEGDDASGQPTRTRRVSLGRAVNPEEVAEGLQQNTCSGSVKSFGSGADSDDDEAHLTPEQLAHKREFEKKRKLHYNEGAALKAMKTLLDEDMD